jgi:hypothetical protein
MTAREGAAGRNFPPTALTLEGFVTLADFRAENSRMS